MALQTFTVGQVLTAAQVTALQNDNYNQTVSTKTANHILVAADVGTRVYMNAAGSTTITVNTGIFAAGDTLFLGNIGAGSCVVTAGTATVSKFSTASLTLSQYQGAYLYFVSTGVAILYSDSAGASTPLTTKGDLYGFSTLDARIPIGTNNQVLTADSAEALGLKWATPAGGGKVLQVVSTAKTDTFTQTTGGFADVTGLSVSITPTLASSKILVLVSLSASAAVAANSSAARLVRAGTDIFIGDTASNRTRVTIAILQGETQYPYSNHISFLDSPATTSATTYKIQVIGLPTGGSTFVNRGQTDTDSSTFTRSASSITVMEIGA